MDPLVVDRYLEEIPSVIINATRPLGDEKCWAVYITLLKEDGLRFNRIKEIFNAQPAEISRVLKSLANAGLIAKQVRSIDDIGNTEASYYTPTTLGKNLIKSLYNGLLPMGPAIGGSSLTGARATPKLSFVIPARLGLQPLKRGMQITGVGNFQYKEITASKGRVELHAK